jgi:hypothetical protein
MAGAPLDAFEAERLIQELRVFPILELGSSR